jgi:hypothetical protein
MVNNRVGCNANEDWSSCSAGGLCQKTRTSTPSQKIVLKANAIMMPEP